MQLLKDLLGSTATSKSAALSADSSALAPATASATASTGLPPPRGNDDVSTSPGPPGDVPESAAASQNDRRAASSSVTEQLEGSSNEVAEPGDSLYNDPSLRGRARLDKVGTVAPAPRWSVTVAALQQHASANQVVHVTVSKLSVMTCHASSLSETWFFWRMLGVAASPSPHQCQLHLVGHSNVP